MLVPTDKAQCRFPGRLRHSGIFQYRSTSHCSPDTPAQHASASAGGPQRVEHLPQSLANPRIVGSPTPMLEALPERLHFSPSAHNPTSNGAAVGSSGGTLWDPLSRLFESDAAMSRRLQVRPFRCPPLPLLPWRFVFGVQ